MKQGTLAWLINDYQSKIDTVNRSGMKAFSDVERLLKDFFDKVELLDEVEDEILTYLQKSLSTRVWEDGDLWLGAMITHPSSKYVGYLLELLEEPDPSYLHWHALDVLAWMPESISEEAVPGLIRIMESHNPAWSETVLEKAFETLVYIGAYEGLAYIIKVFHSGNKALEVFAEKWVDQFLEFEMVHLDDLVPKNHPLRRINEAIDFSSLSSNIPALDPEGYINPIMLLKLLFLGYFYEMSSERLIIDRAGFNIPCRWFAGLSMTDQVPSQNALTENRRRVAGIAMFQEIFDELVLQAVNKGFIEKGNILRGEYYDPEGGDVRPEAIRASTQNFFGVLEVETKTDWVPLMFKRQ